MLDVIVIGAGPGGCAAAKSSVEQGLKTLIVEKKRLPRDKVCSGILAGETAKKVTREIFGDFPDGVLVPPYYLKGQIVYVQGADPAVVEQRMPIAWRRDLDYWMTEKAKEQGAEVLDSARVIGLSERKGGYLLTIERKGEREELDAKFIIGADGSASWLRGILFPDLEVHHNQQIRECYEGNFPLDRDYLHTFYDPVRQFWFLVNHKGDSFLLEVSGNLGETKKLKEKVVKPFLAENYAFDVNRTPKWIDGTYNAKFYDELISERFFPAVDNIMLVGDAGGFQLPTGEGIGTALQTGLLAASAAAEAMRKGSKASDIYLKEIRGIREFVKEINALTIRGRFTIAENPQSSVSALVEMVKVSLKPIL